MTPPSPEVSDALTYHADEQIADEVWIGPGLSLCQGRAYLYLNPRGSGQIAVVPVNWLAAATVRDELARRARMPEDVRRAHLVNWRRQ